MLGARDLAELEFLGCVRGICDELGKNLGDMVALASGIDGREGFHHLWYLHCEAALSSEGPSFFSIPAIRAAMTNHKSQLNLGTLYELLRDVAPSNWQSQNAPKRLDVGETHLVESDQPEVSFEMADTAIDGESQQPPAVSNDPQGLEGIREVASPHCDGRGLLAAAAVELVDRP